MSNTDENQVDWKDVMSRHAASGQTQKQFCQTNGISYKQFKYHRYQIIPPTKSKPKESKATKEFAEIKIKPNLPRNTITIKYPNGCECHLPSCLPTELLATILKGVSVC